MGRSLKLIRGNHEVPVFFFDLAEQVMQLGSVFFFEEVVHKLPRWSRVCGQQIRKRQVIPIVVRRWSDFLSLLEIWNRGLELTRANVQFAQVVIRIETVGIEDNGLFQLVLDRKSTRLN